MVQQSLLKEFQRRINPKVQKGNVFEKVKCPRSENISEISMEVVITMLINL